MNTKPYLKLFILALLPFCMLQPSFADVPLPPDEAFKLQVSFLDKNTLVAELVPAKDHYLYKEKIHFAVKNSSGVVIKEIRLPPGEAKNDRNFGVMEIYRRHALVPITLTRGPKARSLTLLATYQGCNEKLGLCYPPIEKSLNLILP